VRSFGPTTLDDNALPKLRKRILAGDTLNLNKVRPIVAEAGVQKMVLHGIVVREQKQALAVGIQSPNAVDIFRKRSVRTQR
jgi:hypothetical protein